jgi:RTX calcium-binding nonapeptide repeat (4 copies)
MRALGAGMLVAGLLVFAAPASAAFPDDGKLWRPVPQTTGLTWSQVASVCPADGANRCAGAVGGRDLTGWIWATDAQVIALMGAYDPAILTADPPQIGGPEHLLQAITFVEDVKPTFFFSGYVDTNGSTNGWTATEHVAAGASYSYPYFAASFGVAEVADEASPYRGVWLWRPAGDDLTPPVIRPVLSGTAGANGWFTSDVRVTWDIQDAQSAVTSSCAGATVTGDTTGAMFTCTAASSGGTATATAVVKRDTVPPVLTCGANAFELYQVGAAVSAAVTDATSGPAQPTAQVLANTSATGTFSATLTGTDRAGLRASATCAYRVSVPSCNGLVATIVGTGANNTINGTAGRDVIAGLGGADTIDGKGGDDVICGGDGPDTLSGGDGNDWIDGGASSDSIRGDGGRDTCISGEARMSSCEA